jgi:hypothetical protein
VFALVWGLEPFERGAEAHEVGTTLEPIRSTLKIDEHQSRATMGLTAPLA